MLHRQGDLSSPQTDESACRGMARGVCCVALLVTGTGIYGLCASVYNIGQVSFRQRLCPDRLLG